LSSVLALAAVRSLASLPKPAIRLWQYSRPLEDFASDESEQTRLYLIDDRIVDGNNPIQMGSNNSGKAGGSQYREFLHDLAAVSAGVV
jgi:hypothetical protein